MDIITILIASISFVVVIATTVIYAQKSVDIQRDYDSKFRTIRKQVNDVQDESVKYDLKQQNTIDTTKTSLEDIQKQYVKKGDIASKITTESLQATNINGSTYTGKNINVDELISGATKFKNIGASIDRAWNNNPSLTFDENTDFAIHASKSGASANLWVDGGLNVGKNVEAENGIFKRMNINGNNGWASTIKNNKVTMEMANSGGNGLNINSINSETGTYGLNIGDDKSSKFKVYNDGRQELNTDLNPDDWAWTWKSSGKGGLGAQQSVVNIGRENDGIDIMMNNDNPNRNALRLRNINKELLKVNNVGDVNVPGTLLSGTNVASRMVIQGEKSVSKFDNINNKIVGQTTFEEGTKFYGGMQIMNADGTATTLGGAGNSLMGTTNATDFITNNIKFSKNFSEYPDTVNDRAEIANDQNQYKTLMIVGNKARNGMQRTVGVWDRLDVNGPLYPDSISMSGSGGLAVGSLNKANPGEVSIRTRDLEDVYTIFNDLQNQNFIRGATTTVDTPLNINKAMTLKSPLMVASENGGPLVERNMGTNDNRAGIGSFLGGATRVYAANATSVPSASINFSFAKSDGTFDDVVTVNAYKETTINGPTNIVGKLSTTNQMCINNTCLTESDIQKLKGLP